MQTSDSVSFELSAEQVQKTEAVDVKKVRIPVSLSDGKLVVSTGLRCGQTSKFNAVNAPFKTALLA